MEISYDKTMILKSDDIFKISVSSDKINDYFLEN
jgi:hypothetical protein